MARRRAAGLDNPGKSSEALPLRFVATFEHDDGAVQLRIDGVGEVGNPLTDASVVADGYRYHDVLHLAFAVCLDWSPVLRTLTGRKRRSNPLVDEREDGGRARIVEEALCHVVHIRCEDAGDGWRESASDPAFLAYLRRLARGFEVETQSEEAWRNAVVTGVARFRDLKENGGGTIVADRKARTLTFIHSCSQT